MSSIAGFPYPIEYRKESEDNYYKEAFVPAQNISYAIVSPVIQELGRK